MIVSSELRGESYRDAAWVDRYGWLWEWDAKRQEWHGWHPMGPGSGECFATDDLVSNYGLFGGRGPFRKLAPNLT